MSERKKLGNRKREAAFATAFAERLRRAAQTHEVGALATRVGVTPTTLYRWLSGRFDPSLPKLSEFADATDTSLAWLVTGEGPTGGRQARRHALLEGYGITEFYSSTGLPAKPPLAFQESWLLALLYGPANEPTLFSAADLKSPLLIAARDDSMAPTIAKGDLLLVDRAFGIRPSVAESIGTAGPSLYDGIYLFKPEATRSDEQAVATYIVRRVQHRVDGAIILRCDNMKYPEESYSITDRARPAPVGRVLWRGAPI